MNHFRQKGLNLQIYSSFILFNMLKLTKAAYHKQTTALPIQARFALQYMGMDQLFKQTVHQDGQRGEADVVQGQINTVVQGLGWTYTAFQSTQFF